MNWLKKGPELKLPKLRKPTRTGGKGKGAALKPPAFLADLYYDLRDRRLLLPIALVVVAIVAVPFLLGDSDTVVPPPAALNPSPGPGDVAGASLAVVEATPGLRDYRKRLGNRTPTNPFKQRYTSLPEDAKVESTSVDSTAGGNSGEASLEGVEEGGDGGTAPAPADEGGETRFYELVIDVQIRRTETTPDGAERRGELETRRNVPVLTQLPGKKTPVVTTMGANYLKGRIFLLASDQVESIRGEYGCVTRGEICELLEVRIGNLLEFVYEPSGARYEVKVTDADLVPLRDSPESRSAGLNVPRSLPGLALEGGSGSVSEIAQTKPIPR